MLMLMTIEGFRKHFQCTSPHTTKKHVIQFNSGGRKCCTIPLFEQNQETFAIRCYSLWPGVLFALHAIIPLESQGAECFVPVYLHGLVE